MQRDVPDDLPGPQGDPGRGLVTRSDESRLIGREVPWVAVRMVDGQQQGQ